MNTLFDRSLRLILLSFVFPLLLAACQLTPPEKRGGEKNSLSQSKLIELGRNAESRGDHNAALAFYRQANAGFPDAVEPAESIARLFGNIKSYNESAQAYEYLAGIRKSDQAAQDYLKAGQAWLRARKATNATNAYKNALQIDPKLVKAYSGMGVALDLLGNHDAAQKEYEKALEISPTDSSAINNLSLSLMVTGDTERAISLLEPLARTHENNQSYVSNLAMAYAMSDQTDLARTVLATISEGSALENNIAAFKKLADMTPVQRARFIFNSQLAQ